jgi:alkaline phosphatase D
MFKLHYLRKPSFSNYQFILHLLLIPSHFFFHILQFFPFSNYVPFQSVSIFKFQFSVLNFPFSIIHYSPFGKLRASLITFLSSLITHHSSLITASFLLLCSIYAYGQKPIKIAFGSCGHQDKPLSILKTIAKSKPDYFIYLGDNIYGDTRDMAVMKAKYDKLAQNKNFKALKKATSILATWDDHDFGENDAGKNYPFKEESKKLFLDFFGEPTGSQRRERPGIYTSQMIETKDGKVQIILLDTRTFRDELRHIDSTFKGDTIFNYKLDYAPILSPDSTLLGTAQWRWLEAQLRNRADLRIICSSTQFGISYNGYEAWANFPREREKMLDVIQRTRANSVIFISGDVHYGELSKFTNEKTYPIYDLTSSGLTQTWDFATPNSKRIAGPVMENHYGQLLINFKTETIRLQIINHKKEVKIDYPIQWKKLDFFNPNFH